MIHRMMPRLLIHKCLPEAAARVLGIQLKEMAEDGLVTKTIYPELPPRSEYKITEPGLSLLPIIDAMLKWGEGHFDIIASMPIASSTYWNEVHGFTAEDVEKDLEGLQTMRNLGRNIAFMIKAFKAQAAIEGIPEQERGSFTSLYG